VRLHPSDAGDFDPTSQAGGTRVGLDSGLVT
jgi:hypothetical protein